MTETPPHAAEASERTEGAGDTPSGRTAAAGLEALSIRRLTYADLPQVIAIERRAFPTPWSLAMFVLELSKPSGICLAATIGDRLVGYLVCSRYDRVWHLMNVAVDLHLRRRGVATAMMHELFGRADGESTQYTLEVRLSNRSAIAMYERFGFRPAGKRRGYYHDNREDALIMWRTMGADGAAAGAP
jgi:[ribosomal protein S18]-alanine N-acetyltransferase